MTIGSSTRPPPKKDSAWNKCFGQHVTSVHTASVHPPSALWWANKFWRACQLLVNRKMNRRKKSLLCSCALNHNKRKHQQRQTITQHDAVRRLFRHLAAAKERQEEKNNNQNGFFFRWGEGAISPEPKKDDGARCCGKGASVPHRARSGNKTQQSKRELCVDIPWKEKETTMKMVLFFLLGRGRHFSEPKKDDRAWCCGEGASSVLPQHARK